VINELAREAQIEMDAPVGKQVRHSTVGTVVFDDKKNPHLGGWASVAGAEPFRVSSHVGLDNKVMWISNLDYQAFREFGLSSARNHRLSYYFYRTIEQVSADLGVSIRLDPTSAPQAAQATSRIFDRVLTLAETGYTHKTEYPFTGKTLTEDIRSACGILDTSNRGPDFLESAFASAYQTDSFCATQNRQPDTSMIVLRRNRVHHFAKILDYMLPAEQNWKTLDLKTLPPGNAARLDFVLNTNHPVLAEITVDTSQCRDEMVTLMAYGSQSGMRSRASLLRTHATHPELLWLSKFCNVEISSISIAKEYVRPRPSATMPTLLTLDPLNSLSYSAGLFAEIHFMAMAEATKRQHTNGNQIDKNISARNLWLRAYDRAEMFIYARRAMEAGFVVSGYAMGALRLTTDHRELPKVMEFALDNGFVYPIFQVLASSIGYVFNDDTWMDADD
jgi:hypothetical protein